MYGTLYMLDLETRDRMGRPVEQTSLRLVAGWTAGGKATKASVGSRDPARRD